MTAAAPEFRSVDALTGERAESPVLTILAKADEISGQAAEVERLRDENYELSIRCHELWQQVCEKSTEIEFLRSERNTLRAAVSAVRSC